MKKISEHQEATKEERRKYFFYTLFGTAATFYVMGLGTHDAWIFYGHDYKQIIVLLGSVTAIIYGVLAARLQRTIYKRVYGDQAPERLPDK